MIELSFHEVIELDNTFLAQLWSLTPTIEQGETKVTISCVSHLHYDFHTFMIVIVTLFLFVHSGPALLNIF